MSRPGPVPLTERQALLAFNAVPEIGPLGRKRLLDAFAGDVHAALAACRRERTAVEFDGAAEERRLAGMEAAFLVPSDPIYPKLLREIPDPPVGLYCQGMLTEAETCVAVVGTRKGTLYGRQTAKSLGRDLASMGFCVVSGLARGIDAAAHEGALEAGGRTVAVLGTGLDLVYPRENKGLARRIGRGGALLSELPLGHEATKQTFPMRNRIVAGMSIATIVVESAAEGGAMITARLAADQGRTVFAVPGRIDQPTSDGCHHLIREGATLLTSADDVLAEISYLKPAAPKAHRQDGGPLRRSGREDPAAPLSSEEKRILACFRGGSILPADEIAAQTGLPFAAVSATLLGLELKRRVERQLDGRFEASAPG